MKTIFTVAEQKQYLADNWEQKTWSHKWSCRGEGSSRIVDGKNDVIGSAGGGGYDRYGAALGAAIIASFPAEILKLAKRECKGMRRDYKQSPDFYGLFYNSITKKAWVDGGCGSGCMEKILNKIGFSLEFAGEHAGNNSGQVFMVLKPVTKHQRKFLK